MRPGDAAWSRAEAAWLTPPEREECPECGGDVCEDDDGVRCIEPTPDDDGDGDQMVGCGWRIDRPEPNDYEPDDVPDWYPDR